MSFLLADYNIPFLVALGCSMLLALVQIVAGFGEGGGDGHDGHDADDGATGEHDDDHHAQATDDALAANDGVSQRLELERMRLSAQVEVSVAQSRAMGEAVAAMDFKLYGTPETAQQILRLMGLADGIGNVIQSAPVPLREIGARVLDRVAPANGSAAPAGNGAAAAPAYAAALPLLGEGAQVLTALLTPEQHAAATVSAAVDLALGRADDAQRAVLLKVQGALLMLPDIGARNTAEVLASLHL